MSVKICWDVPCENLVCCVAWVGLFSRYVLLMGWCCVRVCWMGVTCSVFLCDIVWRVVLYCDVLWSDKFCYVLFHVVLYSAVVHECVVLNGTGKMCYDLLLRTHFVLLCNGVVRFFYIECGGVLFRMVPCCYVDGILQVWFNTLRPIQNGGHFADGMLRCIFVNLLNFKRNFTEMYSLWSNWQYGSIGLDNGLAPNRRQAII